MSKTIDFTKGGGIPITQNQLRFMQEGYTEVLNALAAMGLDGATPYVLSGMAVSGGGNTVSDGWFVYNGDIIQFTGSTVTPAIGEVALVLIAVVANATAETYYDGSSPNVLLNKTASLTHAATATDATHFPVSALVPFGVGFGINNREAAWNTIAVSTAAGVGGVTGNIDYRKDFTANTLHIKGSLTSNNAQNLTASPGSLFYIMDTLPAGYIPANLCFFVAHYFLAGLIKDDLGISWIKQVNCAVNTAGQFLVNWIKPDVAIAGYGINFNAIIQLD